MTNTKPYHKHSPWNLVVLCVVTVLIAGWVIYSVGQVEKGPGQTVSKASRDTYLTPGDDALSLEDDLIHLGADSTDSLLTELESIE